MLYFVLAFNSSGTTRTIVFGNIIGAHIICGQSRMDQEEKNANINYLFSDLDILLSRTKWDKLY